MTATLELQLDPSGIRRGAAEAERSLADLDRASQRTAAYVDGIYSTLGQRSESAARGVRNLGDAFQSVGGSLQVGQGISQVLQSLERADIAGAGTNVARTLLEISKTGQDFRQLASGVGATGGAFATLRTVMAAHPILTIASVVGLAATAFSVLSSNADKATTSVERQVTALDRLRDGLREVEVRAGFGGGDPRTSSRGTVDTLTALTLSDQRSFQSADVARLLGISDQDFRYLLYQGGAGESALQLSQFDRRLGLGRFQNTAFDRQTTLNAAEILLRQRREQEQLGAFQRGAPQPNLDAIGGTRLPLTQYGPGADDWEQEQERRAAALEEFQQQVQELRQVGAEVGSTFASAFESVISGANSAREAVAALARSLGSSLLQSVFRNLGSSFGGLFAGSGPSDRTRSVDAPGWEQA